MEEKNLIKCPCCENHCSCDALQCGKGRRYFNNDAQQTTTDQHDHKHSHGGKGRHHHHGEEDMDKDEQLRMLLRRCGHVLWLQNGGKESQKRILSILARHDVMTQKELQEELDIKLGSLSEILGKIEKDALIERTANEQDRRNINVKLTETEKQAVQEHREEKQKETKEMFACLSEEEKDQLFTSLHKLVHSWKSEGKHNHHKHKKDNR